MFAHQRAAIPALLQRPQETLHAAASNGGRWSFTGAPAPRRAIPAPPTPGGGLALKRVSPRKRTGLDLDPDGIRYALQDTGDGGGRAARGASMYEHVPIRPDGSDLAEAMSLRRQGAWFSSGATEPDGRE